MSVGPSIVRSFVFVYAAHACGCKHARTHTHQCVGERVTAAAAVPLAELESLRL